MLFCRMEKKLNLSFLYDLKIQNNIVMISMVGIMFKLLFFLFILKYFKLQVFTITSNLVLSSDMVTISSMTVCKCPCFISHHMRGKCVSLYVGII